MNGVKNALSKRKLTIGAQPTKINFQNDSGEFPEVTYCRLNRGGQSGPVLTWVQHRF